MVIAEDNMRHGFTILETTLCVCLVSILTAIALPRFSRIVDAIEVRSAALAIETAFAAARHLAIARGAQASVDIDTAARVVSVRIGTDTLRKVEFPRERAIQLQATRSSMSYSAIGVGYGAANLTVVVKRNAAFDSVVVSRLGRVRH